MPDDEQQRADDAENDGDEQGDRIHGQASVLARATGARPDGIAHGQGSARSAMLAQLQAGCAAFSRKCGNRSLSSEP